MCQSPRGRTAPQGAGGDFDFNGGGAEAEAAAAAGFARDPQEPELQLAELRLGNNRRFRPAFDPEVRHTLYYSLITTRLLTDRNRRGRNRRTNGRRLLFAVFSLRHFLSFPPFWFWFSAAFADTD